MLLTRGAVFTCVRLQMLWMSLESVFTGGDIARQMPQDTRVFMKVDKEWTTRLMNKAKDVKNVVDSCQNEYIKNMLPAMFVDLERFVPAHLNTRCSHSLLLLLLLLLLPPLRMLTSLFLCACIDCCCGGTGARRRWTVTWSRSV